MDPIKAAAGAGAVALVIGGTAYGIYNSIDPMPECDVLSSISGFGTTGDYQSSESKYGYYYGRYLVDPDKITGSKNKDWWEWSFRLWKSSNKSELGSKFKDVKSSYKSDSDNNEKDKALNQICKAAYKEAKTSVTAAGSNSQFKESDVWLFCSISPTRTKPVLLKDSGTQNIQEDKNLIEDTATDEKWGKKYKDDLVSTRVSSNDWFWSLREKEYPISAINETVDNSTQDIFKLRKNNRKTVKQTCQDAYEKVSSNTNEVPEQELKKYCFLEKISN
ncbi:hypothetical protein [Candidatus Mycoplasma haematohominis]|uniref:hypothetical protein n=1 Tax=Candidatus Mycoplasma haematohominis TaxID=1494318 RepID=UPI001C0A6E2A|nr:hypothetical protein [Candidatus Mycoplasma haemohominis]